MWLSQQHSGVLVFCVGCQDTQHCRNQKKITWIEESSSVGQAHVSTRILEFIAGSLGD